MADIARMLYGATLMAKIALHTDWWVRRVSELLRRGYSHKAVARIIWREEA